MNDHVKLLEAAAEELRGQVQDDVAALAVDRLSSAEGWTLDSVGIYQIWHPATRVLVDHCDEWATVWAYDTKVRIEGEQGQAISAMARLIREQLRADSFAEHRARMERDAERPLWLQVPLRWWRHDPFVFSMMAVLAGGSLASLVGLLAQVLA